MTDQADHTSSQPTDDRLADSDVESLLDEERDVEVPDEERVVPEDTNAHIPNPPDDY